MQVPYMGNSCRKVLGYITWIGVCVIGSETKSESELAWQIRRSGLRRIFCVCVYADRWSVSQIPKFLSYMAIYRALRYKIYMAIWCEGKKLKCNDFNTLSFYIFATYVLYGFHTGLIEMSRWYGMNLWNPLQLGFCWGIASCTSQLLTQKTLTLIKLPTPVRKKVCNCQL